MPRISIFLFTLLLPACAVTIDEVKSPVELPTQFSQSGSQKISTHWWQAFHDDELNRLCEQALANNFSLKAAYNQLQQAQAIAKQSGAPLIPQLNASLTDTSKITEKETTNVLSLGLGFATFYEVDLWGRIRTAQNAAILDAQASQTRQPINRHRNEAVSQQALNQYANTLLTAVGEVENALIQEKQQQQLVQNLTQQLQLAQQASERIRARYLFGAMDFLRVLSADTASQNLERTLLQAEQQLFDYRIALYKALASSV
jgi:outer membrane protein TolC